jgi:hypothetical protein
MSIPKEWLQRPISVADVEARLAQNPPVDGWLEDWRTLVAAMRPGDGAAHLASVGHGAGSGRPRRLNLAFARGGYPDDDHRADTQAR